ncbi:MAG: signal peptidase II [Ktedonobacterales bacterium]
MSSARRNDVVMVAVGGLLILLDQLAKLWITQYFTTDGRLDSSIPIVGNILELIYIQNRGVAFSLLNGQESLYVLIAIAIGVIVWLYWRARDTGSLLLKVTFGLIIGGAIGNLIDRLRLGYVVDFIHFQIPSIGFNFAVFNLADTGITIGVIMLIGLLLLSNKPAAEPRRNVASLPPATNDAAVTRLRVRRRI